MIRHSDRIPAFPSVAPASAGTPRPWALGLMTPYPDPAVPGYTVALDPVRQTGIFRDEHGAVIEWPRHGTSTFSRPPTGTSHDGTQDADQGQDADQ